MGGTRYPVKPSSSATSGLRITVDAKELVQALFRLEKVAKKRVASKVIRRAGSPIRAEAKSRVPVRTGDLKRSIRTYVTIRRYTVYGKVESRLPYAHLVELGTKEHYQTRKLKNEKKKRKVKHPGAKPKPFLRPAFDSKRDEAVANARQTLYEEIRKNTK
jgi:HK97 gp10 family phage protein